MLSPWWSYSCIGLMLGIAGNFFLAERSILNLIFLVFALYCMTSFMFKEFMGFYGLHGGKDTIADSDSVGAGSIPAEGV